jgi:hypothetical protein
MIHSTPFLPPAAPALSAIPAALAVVVFVRIFHDIAPRRCDLGGPGTLKIESRHRDPGFLEPALKGAPPEGANLPQAAGVDEYPTLSPVLPAQVLDQRAGCMTITVDGTEHDVGPFLSQVQVLGFDEGNPPLCLQPRNLIGEVLFSGRRTGPLSFFVTGASSLLLVPAAASLFCFSVPVHAEETQPQHVPSFLPVTVRQKDLPARTSTVATMTSTTMVS